MKNRIIEICELGQPQSIIHRENEPITELINTEDLIKELNQQLRLHVVGSSLPDLAECNQASLDYATKKKMHFDKWLKFLKWEQIGNSYVYKQGNRYKDANELKQIHTAYLKN